VIFELAQLALPLAPQLLLRAVNWELFNLPPHALVREHPESILAAQRARLARAQDGLDTGTAVVVVSAAVREVGFLDGQ